VVDVEVSNLTRAPVDEQGAAELARRVLAAEGLEDGEVGVQFVSPERIAELKGEHLGVHEATDVLSFPIDGRDDLPPGVPRQLGDVVLCPEVVGERWQEPLVHGLLHLLGYDHGAAMESRERLHAG
jgi:probable rRNA maturation factor